MPKNFLCIATTTNMPQVLTTQATHLWLIDDIFPNIYPT